MAAPREPGDRSGGTPMQNETSAYLARLSTSPTRAYRLALNGFIYEMKRASLLTAMKTCKVLAGPSQADSILDVINASYDGAIVGTLTHTAYKGLSGFTASNRFTFGVNYSTLFASDAFMSCVVGTFGGGTGDLITQSTGSNTPGGFNIGSSLLRPGGLTASGVSVGPSGEGFVAGGVGAATGINPASGSFTGASSSSGRGTTLQTAPVAAPHGIGLLAGHMAMDPGLTGKQYRKATVLFANLFEILDALS